ncbi:MAG: peptidoglycan DD-metalloendopeptidase family protein [Caulobacter sp.]|nr:peptidoglycan DD-metalloendopeptidase family protein [Caulobacter sp.]
MNRRAALLGLAGAALSGPALASAPPLKLSGAWRQGGFAFGRTTPRADLWLDGEAVGQASAHGLFVIGFDRDAAATATLKVATPSGAASHVFDVAPGDFDVQRIDGLPDSQVNPSDPALLKLIREQNSRKVAGLASRVDSDDFRNGFAMPLKAWRRTGRFGGQRILNGDPKRPHYGTDLAAPTGTPILAPAAGTVSLAETGMHYEGGLVMLDHGQGLVSMYLHQSKVLVQAGQRLARGQQIGAVGQTGRATGPHLCWRMTWRGRHLDPMLMVGVTAPTA